MIFLQVIAILFLLAIFCQRQVKLSTLRRIEHTMSELNDAVAAIGNDVGELQTAVQAVLALLNQPNPDVAAAVAALQNADAAFDAIRDSLNAAVPTPPTP